MRRVFIKLLPLLCIVYVLCFLDRTNIGMAKERLELDVGISAAAYGLGAGLFFLAYASLEIPSNLIIHKVGARAWITRIMLTWGLISMGMAFVQGELSFYILRILLGAAEAGLYPGILYFLTLWFPHQDRARAQALFLLGAPIAVILGAPLSGALMQMDGVGGLHGWQWMFLIEGLPTVLLAFYVWKVLPDRPTKAKWLDPQTARNLEDFVARQNEEGASSSGNHNFKAALKDRQILIVAALYFTNQISLYAVAYFLPSIMAKAGDFTSFQIGLLVSVPWIFAAVGMLLVSRWAKQHNSDRLWIIIATLGMAIGLSVAAAGPPWIAFAGFCLMGLCMLAPQPLLFTHVSKRLSGVTVAAGLAFINTLGLLGGFFGPNAMGLAEQTTGATTAGLWLLAGLCVVGVVLGALLTKSSAGKDEFRTDPQLQKDARP